MGKAVKSVANVTTNLATGGLVGVNDKGIGGGIVGEKVGVGKLIDGITGKILGEKDPGTPDKQINMYTRDQQNLLNEATGSYNNLLRQNNQITENAGVAQENQIRASADDQERRAQQMVAQRGLGNSAAGLNAILGTKQGISDKIGAVRASLPGQQLQNLNTITSGIGGLLGAQSGGTIYQQGQASQGRVGGLAPLLGAGAGAFFGGPAGAQAGMGIGQAATKIG